MSTDNFDAGALVDQAQIDPYDPSSPGHLPEPDLHDRDNLLYDPRRSTSSSGWITIRNILPIALFVFFLGLWTYELMAENPLPEWVSQEIPPEWRFWLAKGLHVVAYAFLTVLAYLMPVPRMVFWLVVAGLLLHGIGTEVGQTYTANRQGSFRDVMLDWIGVLLGLLILEIASKFRPNRPHHYQS